MRFFYINFIVVFDLRIVNRNAQTILISVSDGDIGRNVKPERFSCPSLDAYLVYCARPIFVYINRTRWVLLLISRQPQKHAERVAGSTSSPGIRGVSTMYTY